MTSTKLESSTPAPVSESTIAQNTHPSPLFQVVNYLGRELVHYAPCLITSLINAPALNFAATAFYSTDMIRTGGEGIYQAIGNKTAPPSTGTTILKVAMLAQGCLNLARLATNDSHLDMAITLGQAFFASQSVANGLSLIYQGGVIQCSIACARNFTNKLVIPNIIQIQTEPTVDFKQIDIESSVNPEKNQNDTSPDSEQAQNEPSVDPEKTQDDTSLDSIQTEIEPSVDPEKTKDDTSLDSIQTEIEPSVDPEKTQKDPNLISKQTQNEPTVDWVITAAGALSAAMGVYRLSNIMPKIDLETMTNDVNYFINNCFINKLSLKNFKPLVDLKNWKVENMWKGDFSHLKNLNPFLSDEAKILNSLEFSPDATAKFINQTCEDAALFAGDHLVLNEIDVIRISKNEPIADLNSRVANMEAIYNKCISTPSAPSTLEHLLRTKLVYPTDENCNSFTGYLTATNTIRKENYNILRSAWAFRCFDLDPTIKRTVILASSRPGAFITSDSARSDLADARFDNFFGVSENMPIIRDDTLLNEYQCQTILRLLPKPGEIYSGKEYTRRFSTCASALAFARLIKKCGVLPNVQKTAKIHLDLFIEAREWDDDRVRWAQGSVERAEGSDENVKLLAL